MPQVPGERNSWRDRSCIDEKRACPLTGRYQPRHAKRVIAESDHSE